MDKVFHIILENNIKFKIKEKLVDMLNVQEIMIDQIFFYLMYSFNTIFKKPIDDWYKFSILANQIN